MIITDIAQEDFRGNIYVVRSGDTVFEYSGGYADLTNRRPNTMETRFGCASGSKAFVAAGILRLIHQGKIRFDDTIGKLLDIGYRTNIYSLDAKGTGAGGAFVTVGDIMRFWRGLLDGRLFPKELADDMMNMHSGDGADPEEGWYGYGLWLIEKAGGGYIPYFQGCDEGATFISEYHPDTDTISVAVSNYGDNVWKVMRNIRSKLY